MNERGGDAPMEDDEFVEMNEHKGWISEWLWEKKTISFIWSSFNKFLRLFKDEDAWEVYDERIQTLV